MVDQRSYRAIYKYSYKYILFLSIFINILYFPITLSMSLALEEFYNHLKEYTQDPQDKLLTMLIQLYNQLECSDQEVALAHAQHYNVDIISQQEKKLRLVSDCYASQLEQLLNTLSSYEYNTQKQYKLSTALKNDHDNLQKEYNILRDNNKELSNSCDQLKELLQNNQITLTNYQSSNMARYARQRGLLTSILNQLKYKAEALESKYDDLLSRRK